MASALVSGNLATSQNLNRHILYIVFDSITITITSAISHAAPATTSGAFVVCCGKRRRLLLNLNLNSVFSYAALLFLLLMLFFRFHS